MSCVVLCCEIAALRTHANYFLPQQFSSKQLKSQGTFWDWKVYEWNLSSVNSVKFQVDMLKSHYWAHTEDFKALISGSFGKTGRLTMADGDWFWWVRPTYSLVECVECERNMTQRWNEPQSRFWIFYRFIWILIGFSRVLFDSLTVLQNVWVWIWGSVRICLVNGGLCFEIVWSTSIKGFLRRLRDIERLNLEQGGYPLCQRFFRIC